jgi:heptosyltransferase-2
MKKLLKDFIFFFLYYIHAFSKLRKRPNPGAEAKTILVISWHLIGDSFLSLPVIHALKKRLPGARITVLCKPFVREVFGQLPEIDDVIVIADEELTGPNINRLIHEKFDVVIDLTNNLKSYFFVLLARGKYKVGGSGSFLLLGRRYTGFPLLFDKMADAPGNEYIINYLWGITRLFLNEITLDPDWRFEAGDSCGADRAEKDKVQIGICIGASRHENLWEPQKWMSLISRLTEIHGARVFVFGGAAEKQLLPALESIEGTDVISLVGRTNILEAIGKIRSMDYFISNDTGLMHVAIHNKIPTVCLIGPTDPANYVPGDSLLTSVVKKNIYCQPCYKFLYLADQQMHEDCRELPSLCKKMITVDDVIDGLFILRQNRKGTRDFSKSPDGTYHSDVRRS